MFRKIIALVISLTFAFEQTGFAQIAANPDISGMIAGMVSPQTAFRPLHFRSLSFDAASGAFQVYVDKGSAKTTGAAIQRDSGKLFEYFLTGLTLPNSTFWVNLRPDHPDTIIDPLLNRTDAGKVLLEADLQLKKDLARFTAPDTATGRQYWNKLYAKAEALYGASTMNIPTLTRPWVVPGEIVIAETATGAYIYKATLKVMLEQDYLKNSPVFNFDDARLKELNAYSARLIRDIMLPRLTKEINSSRRYAALRQVYYSLILAQWFKKHFSDAGTYSGRIDSKNLSGLTSPAAWSKDPYFQAYRDSFTKGEYNKEETVTNRGRTTVRKYLSGGFAIGTTADTATRIPVKNLDDVTGPRLAQLTVSGTGLTLDQENVPAPSFAPQRDGGNFALDWKAIETTAQKGFSKATELYLALFSPGQKDAFVEYFKGDTYIKDKQGVLNADTMTFDLQSPNKDVLIYGNGLGVLSVIHRYMENLIERNNWQDGQEIDLLDFLSKNAEHATVITAGGKAQRNPLGTDVGKCKVTVPMKDATGTKAAEIFEPLLNLGINIEQNYKDEFMFAVIYGDALISFDPADLAKSLNNPAMKKGLCCLLLKMDWQEATKYGFAKVDPKTGKIEKFQEKFTDKERKEAKEAKEKEVPAYAGAKTDKDEMKIWLRENGYLVEDKYILMNPAFSVLGLDAFIAYARLAGVIDDTNKLVVKDGKPAINDKSLLSRAFNGDFGKKFEIDNYGGLVSAFASIEKEDADKNVFDRAIESMGYKGNLYGALVLGDWYDTGTGLQERDIILQKDAFKGLAATFGLLRSINSKVVIRGKKWREPAFTYNSYLRSAAGGINPTSILRDCYLDVKKVRLEEGSQVFNAMLKDVASLHLVKDHVYKQAAIIRDGRNFISSMVWNVALDDVKKPLYGGLNLKNWAGENGLLLDVKNDLFSTRLFPLVSPAMMYEGKPLDALDKRIYEALPEIIEFLQVPGTEAPEAYLDAVKAGRVASFEDTYKFQAAAEMVALRKRIADAVTAVQKNDTDVLDYYADIAVKPVLGVNSFVKYQEGFAARVAHKGLQQAIQDDADLYLKVSQKLMAAGVTAAKFLGYTYDPAEDVAPARILTDTENRRAFWLGESQGRDNRPGGTKKRAQDPVYRPYNAAEDALNGLVEREPNKGMGIMDVPVYGRSKKLWIITNAYPIFTRHWQILDPSPIRQQLTLDFLRASLEMISQTPDFTAYFNSRGANASINHPHIQFYPKVTGDAFDRAEIQPLHTSGPLKIGQVVNNADFAVNSYVFEASPDAAGRDVLAETVYAFTTDLTIRDIPHTVIFKDGRIYVVPHAKLSVGKFGQSFAGAEYSGQILMTAAELIFTPFGERNSWNIERYNALKEQIQNGDADAQAQLKQFITDAFNSITIDDIQDAYRRNNLDEEMSAIVQKDLLDLANAIAGRAAGTPQNDDNFLPGLLSLAALDPSTRNSQREYLATGIEKQLDGGYTTKRIAETAQAQKDGGVGGVDFASLPARAIRADRLSPASGLAQVDATALLNQWSRLNKELRLGAVPVREWTELLAAAKRGKDTGSLRKVCAYSIAEIMSAEEESAKPTSDEMTQVLTALLN